jgi:membrane protein
MPRLTDAVNVVKSVGWLGLAKRVWGRMGEHNLTVWAAALAYSWLFAVFPFLIFVLSLVPYAPDGVKKQARGEIQELVNQLPTEAASTVWTNVENVLERPKSGLLIVGLAVAVWAASGGTAMTMSALDRCYGVTGGRPFYVQRPLAILLTLVVATLILLVGVLLPVGSLFKAWLIRRQVITATNIAWIVLFDIIRWVLAMAFLVTSLAVVYHFGPKVKQKFHWLTPGAVFSIVIWIALGLAFRYYVERFGKYEQTYGTVGGVAILLLFFYVDALVLLIGAEINSEIDFEVLQVRRGTEDLRPAQERVEAEEAGAPPAPAPDPAPTPPAPTPPAPATDASP